jgi:hypothetical protein
MPEAVALLPLSMVNGLLATSWKVASRRSVGAQLEKVTQQIVLYILTCKIPGQFPTRQFFWNLPVDPALTIVARGLPCLTTVYFHSSLRQYHYSNTLKAASASQRIKNLLHINLSSKDGRKALEKKISVRSINRYIIYVLRRASFPSHRTLR